MNLSDAVDSITKLFDSAKVPANVLPPMMLKCVALTRPGLSAYRLASQIIKNNEALNIPTDAEYNGEDNKVNRFIYNISKCVVDAMKNDAAVQLAIPKNSIMVQSNGANAGGPITCIGTNLLDSLGNGIIQ
jgi:hypothetical protein